MDIYHPMICSSAHIFKIHFVHANNSHAYFHFLKNDYGICLFVQAAEKDGNKWTRTNIFKLMVLIPNT